MRGVGDEGGRNTCHGFCRMVPCNASEYDDMLWI